MAFIDWSERLSIGVERFDQEHRELVEIVNRIDELLTRTADADELNAMLGKLLEHTAAHFRHEEEDMDRYDYPRAAEHKRLHTALVAQAVALAERPEPIGVNELLFLKNWLLKHVQVTDRHFGEFLLEQGAYPRPQASYF